MWEELGKHFQLVLHGERCTKGGGGWGWGVALSPLNWCFLAALNTPLWRRWKVSHSSQSRNPPPLHFFSRLPLSWKYSLMFLLRSALKTQTCVKACICATALALHPCRWLIMHILRRNRNVSLLGDDTLPCKHIRGCLGSSRLTKRMLNPVCYGRRWRSTCLHVCPFSLLVSHWFDTPIIW